MQDEINASYDKIYSAKDKEVEDLEKILKDITDDDSWAQIYTRWPNNMNIEQ